MNQPDINAFLVHSSSMTKTENDRGLLINPHLWNPHLFETKTTQDRHDQDQDIRHNHDNHHDHENSNNPHDVLMAKTIAMLILFSATMICGSIPFFLKRKIKKQSSNTKGRSATLVKVLLNFGGGVLLCTTFLHLLPEVREVFEKLQECDKFPNMTFPFVEFLMCGGFLLMFLIEELIHKYIHSNKYKDAASFERGHSIRNSHVIGNNVKFEEDNDKQITNSCNKSLSSQNVFSCPMEHQEHQNNNHHKACTTLYHSDPKAQVTQDNSHENHLTISQHSDHFHHHNKSHSHLPLESNNNNGDTKASSLRGILIVMALSIHELFEGLTIGLEGSSSNVFVMFAAVSVHKLVLAFCVGVELIVAQTRTYLSVLFIVTFAIVSPIGIGIGMLVSNQNTTTSSVSSAILEGLACGTLLYVIFFEILSKDRSGLSAYFAFTVGFGLMFGLQQIFNGLEHSHEGC